VIGFLVVRQTPCFTEFLGRCQA